MRRWLPVDGEKPHEAARILNGSVDRVYSGSSRAGVFSPR